MLEERSSPLGPIGNYPGASHITGRAGLYAVRYRSDEVDRRGSLVGIGNRRLRFVLMMIADNLVKWCPLGLDEATWFSSTPV